MVDKRKLGCVCRICYNGCPFRSSHKISSVLNFEIRKIQCNGVKTEESVEMTQEM